MGRSVRIDAYLICATPRTGSTFLCDLLRSTGSAGQPESYFRLPDEQAWADRWRLARDRGGAFEYGDYVRAAVAAGSTPNGVFAARVMWGTLDEIVTKLGTEHPELAGADLELLTRAFGRTRFVYLWRDDAVAQAVSWARAEQTHFWHQGDTTLPGYEPRYDLEQIHTIVQTIHEHNAAWREWFAAVGVQPHLVRYEALASDPAGVTRGILDFLGLQLAPDQVIASRRRRQADQVNQDWITRYRAVAG
jgi:trehalose 2-sulfotransferase